MTNYLFIAAISYSIAIAALIGLVKLPKINRSYLPFILTTILSFINEVISHMLIMHKKSNAVAVNVFGFFDAMLWFWQFRNWNRQYRMALHTIVAALAILWFIENVILRKLFVFGSIYPITFSLVMVIFSSIQLSFVLTQEKTNLLTSPKFLICCGTILFYTYRILIECFYAPGMSKSEIFFGNLFTILSLINFIVNLLFALAVLWIPQKQKFSLPYY